MLLARPLRLGKARGALRGRPWARGTMAAPEYDFDLLVIGGGSGGLACSKKAAALGARVALFDKVKPSPQGSTWGLGGCCSQVGCVPKKLMHYGSLVGKAMAQDARAFGWQVPEEVTQDWEALVETVQNHVRQTSFRYRVALKSAKVQYINALASFVDAHTLEYTLGGETRRATAAHIVIAVGGRPHIPPDVPGAVELAITSDDVFQLDSAPGKTLCVGGSYIALECAGFLSESYDVSVAVRSVLLRGFDRQCAERIGRVMSDYGVKFITGSVPASLARADSGRIAVALRSADGAETVEEFDTVLYATGRRADTAGLNLAAAGVEATADGKVVVDDLEATTAPSVHAVGDVAAGRPELTPVAVRAGELLAQRLFGGSTEAMDYNLVATTVFTPIEYGCVGLSEEAAVERYGADALNVYLTSFTTLELQAAHRTKHPMHGEDEDMENVCLSKLICVAAEDDRVVGVHFVGPNAGEVIQGMALAMRLGARKADFDRTVGIHPTDAESFMALGITRASGADFEAAGGCGGGTCG